MRTRITVFYTKNTSRGQELMFGSPWKDKGEPTPKDIVQDYAIVYESDSDELSPEGVFSLFNGTNNPLRSEEAQKMLKARGVGHTSMSVGDIVQIGDKAYLCRPLGWKIMRWSPELV